MKERNKKYILVVDDEVGIGKVIKKVLSRDGYHVFIASSGEDGLRQLEESAVDLLLVDLKMPTMSGLEMLRQARATHKNLRAILMTAYGTVSSARKAMFFGVYDFLTKPFDNRLLRKVVKEALK